jgi:hypothetical protein
MVSPQRMDFLDWALQLTVDFPRDKIPVPTSEAGWVEWAQRVMESTTFAGSNIPGPDAFPDWREWAQHLYAVLG